MTGAEVAIIGMAGRFPGAATVDQFWKNLVAGKESISFLSGEEVLASGNANRPAFVASKGGVLAEADYFDHAFFNYPPREAEMMDPQFRVFHECVWHALEDAGYAREPNKKLIGLYAGASGNFQWQKQLADSGRFNNRQGLSSIQFVERDFLPTLISYNLDLRGPSYNVQTACSTSLVAVHLACQALLNGECEVAVAGGVCIASGRDQGYIYQEGSILSPDGHCRAFDARAKGAIHGSGAAVVVIKLLEEALAAGDQVYAVIKGSAINNDGKRKVGFTAPSIGGQVQVIQEALRVAELEPTDISYIEAHGTGTELGDPIELEALRTVFGAAAQPYCGIGSVKTNIGHLDAAAGVTGLIKTVLALTHQQIPPSLHFTSPNPKLGLEGSAFYVVDALREWPANGKRRAGVSSFGIGGTNAHVVLEEAPAAQLTPANRTCHIFPFAAKNKESCQEWVNGLSRFLQEHPEAEPGDVAWSLITGRKEFSSRGFVVGYNNQDVMDKIGKGEVMYSNGPVVAQEPQLVTFLFPGQGAQYMQMGFHLYTTEPVYRHAWDKCMSLYKTITGEDLHAIIYPGDNRDNTALINQTIYTQPLLFIIEYCLAQLLFSVNIRPQYMFGHSVGEYAAACLAGVFTLEEALQLVIQRGRLINALPGGSMLSLPLPEEEVAEWLAPYNGRLSLAAVNAPAQCVVSGPSPEIDGLYQQVQAQGVHAVLLKTSHAFHSHMMEPALDGFRNCFDTIALQAPTIPFISCLTGQPITTEEALSPNYWVAQLRNTVRFSAGINYLLKSDQGCLVEVGPGNILTSLVQQHAAKKETHYTTNLVRPPQVKDRDDRYFLERLGRLWLAGLPVHFAGLYANEKRNTISLPGYCFTRKKVAAVVQQPAATERSLPDSWFYTRVWEQLPAGRCMVATPEVPVYWALFAGDDPLSNELAHALAGEPGCVVRISDVASEEDYARLVAAWNIPAGHTLHIIHAWSLSVQPKSGLDIAACDHQMNKGFFSLLNLCRHIGGRTTSITGGIRLTVLANNSFNVTGGELHYPENATLLSVTKILPLEYRGLQGRLIDLSYEHVNGRVPDFVNRLLYTLTSPKQERVSAWRGTQGWQPRIRPVQVNDYALPANWIQDDKVYLVLGFGGMGMHIAKYITETFRSTVYVVHRSQPTADKISLLQQLNQQGKGKVYLVPGDITSMPAMAAIVDEIRQKHGAINGVVHTAGVIDTGGVVQRRSNQSIQEAMASKVKGTLIIETLFRDQPLDGLVVFSSLGNELFEEKYGEIGYSAANEFLEAYAQCPSAIQHKAVINWCDWQEVGMAQQAISALLHNKEGYQEYQQRFREMAIRPEEGVQVFDSVCRSGLNVHLVYPFDLLQRLQQREQTLLNYSSYLELKLNLLAGTAGTTIRPAVLGATITDQVLHVWKEYLGHAEISIHENLFDLGVSSLDVVQVNNIFKSSLNIDVPLTVLFEHPTIQSFLTYLEGSGKEEATVSRAEKIDSGRNKLEKLKKLSGAK